VILLAIDTSTPRAAIALALADGSIRVAHADASVRHGRALLVDVRNLLRDAGLTPSAIDVLAVGLGPGSYTGLRVGVTAAKTLAYALSRPLIGLDSLAVIAENAPDDVREVSVIADAQRGDLYVANFRRTDPNSPLQRLGSTEILPEAAWRARLGPETLVLGPAVARLERIPDVSLPIDSPLHVPDPNRLVSLAKTAFEAGEVVEPWFLEPIYLRRSAAEDQWEAKNRPRPSES
jgi:tRNA threonylcarbamoyladenosine biosynthesis protein TsaB